jgi:TRAP-type uncharacterized transport system substrate-binding protein
LADNSRKYVEKTGFKYSIRTSQGTLENAKLLADPASGVNAAFLIPGALDPETNSKFYSLGSIDYEPIWIFYQKNIGLLSSLKDLKNYRVGVGPVLSGRYVLTEKIFGLNNVEIKNNPQFIVGLLDQQLSDFKSGKLDAVIFVGQAFDKNVRTLVQDPNVSLYHFDQADAYEKSVSFFRKVVLPAGSFNIAENIPSQALSLIAVNTTLAVRKDTPSNIQLSILMAVKEAERAVENPFFAKRNEFPTYMDSLIELSPTAKRFYDVGPPSLIHYLPFWAATLIDRFSVICLTILAILYPLGFLNVHLRKIRFEINESSLYLELVEINRQLARPDITLKELESLKETIGGVRLRATSHRIPIGEEPSYFSFARAIHNLMDETEKKLLLKKTDVKSPAV